MNCKSFEGRPQTEVLAKNELLCTALSMLYQAYQYAIDTSSSPWDFALEIDELRRAKISNSELRWLMTNGFVEHAHERTEHHSDRRLFSQLGNIGVTDRTCFVLTPAGVSRLTGDSATRFFDPSSSSATTDLADSNGNQQACRNGTTEQSLKPSWDGQRKELRFAGQLIRRYRVQAANQEKILTVFEEENWPARVDDPLTPVAGKSANRRLADTIKSLNRNHLVSLIRFRLDGTGTGVIWECTT